MLIDVAGQNGSITSLLISDLPGRFLTASLTELPFCRTVYARLIKTSVFVRICTISGGIAEVIPTVITLANDTQHLLCHTVQLALQASICARCPEIERRCPYCEIELRAKF